MAKTLRTISTGYQSLDDSFGGGIVQGTIVNISGTRASGKTMFALNVLIKSNEKDKLFVTPSKKHINNWLAEEHLRKFSMEEDLDGITGRCPDLLVIEEGITLGYYDMLTLRNKLHYSYIGALVLIGNSTIRRTESDIVLEVSSENNTFKIHRPDVGITLTLKNNIWNGGNTTKEEQNVSDSTGEIFNPYRTSGLKFL